MFNKEFVVLWQTIGNDTTQFIQATCESHVQWIVTDGFIPDPTIRPFTSFLTE